MLKEIPIDESGKVKKETRQKAEEKQDCNKKKEEEDLEGKVDEMCC